MFFAFRTPAKNTQQSKRGKKEMRKREVKTKTAGVHRVAIGLIV